MLKNKLNDLQRKQLCKQLGIDRKTLYNWENYKTKNVFKYIELCEITKTNPFEELEYFRNESKKNSIED